MQPYRLSLAAEFCYGTVGVEISRKYLDSGPLAEEFDAFIKDPSIMGPKFLTLAAGAMTLGCAIPTFIVKTLRSLVQTKNAPAFRTEKARLQMQDAVLGYVDGTPHDFGNKTKDEDFIGKMFPNTSSTVITVGATKLIVTTAPDGKVIPHIIGPPDDEELGVTPIHPYDVCASCGSDKLKANKGQKLLVCGKCKVRKYCSKACQRKHWTLHKPICSRPNEKMEKFLGRIPLDFAGDAHPDYKKILKGSPTVMNGDALAAGMGQQLHH